MVIWTLAGIACYASWPWVPCAALLGEPSVKPTPLFDWESIAIMDYQVIPEHLDQLEASCLLLGFYHKRKLTPTAAAVDQLLGGLLDQLIKRDDLTGKPGELLMVNHTGHPRIERVILVGFGKREDTTVASYRKTLGAVCKGVAEAPFKQLVSSLHEIEAAGMDPCWRVQQFIEIFEAARYRFNELKTDPSPPKLKAIRVGILAADSAETSLLEQGIQRGLALVKGMNLAKDMANLPGNLCTPRYLGDQALKLAKAHKKLKAKVLDEKEIEELGMGAFLSVSKGSEEPARLIVLEYSGGGAKDKPYVLVGKGLTFDAGGISIKPAQGMDEMKYDMCGGASVIGALATVAELQLPLNVVGLIAASENLPSGAANKPGDIVTSMKGLTIEILNTDAEGRLLLCDVLHYAKRFDPVAVVDVATLTGACIVALGRVPNGLWSNNDELAEALNHAGLTSHDRVWRMPLWDEYHDQLKSNFADLANIGGPDAGSVTAACFLSRFAKDYPWAHLDVAGTAWRSGAEKGATGRPVPLLVQYLIDRLP